MTLEEYRKNNKLTYHELAALVGLPYTKIHRVCHNQCDIKISEATKIVNNTDKKVTFQDLAWK